MTIKQCVKGVIAFVTSLLIDKKDFVTCGLWLTPCRIDQKSWTCEELKGVKKKSFFSKLSKAEFFMPSKWIQIRAFTELRKLLFTIFFVVSNVLHEKQAEGSLFKNSCAKYIKKFQQGNIKKWYNCLYILKWLTTSKYFIFQNTKHTVITHTQKREVRCNELGKKKLIK